MEGWWGLVGFTEVEGGYRLGKDYVVMEDADNYDDVSFVPSSVTCVPILHSF